MRALYRARDRLWYLAHVRRALQLAALLLLARARPAPAATFDVDRTDDVASATACTGAADDCSLRGAIIAANGNMGADIIDLPAGTYTLTLAGPAEDMAATGDLDVRDDLVLHGAGAATTIIDGGTLDRVFHVDPAGTTTVTATIDGVTVQHGATSVISFVLSDGAAIRNGTTNTAGGNTGGTLTIANSVVRDSTCPRAGGGIANSGILHVVNSTISGNTAGTLGGGIFQDDAGTLTVDNSTLSGNHADGQSGGGFAMGLFSITADPVVTITSTTISGNSAGSGGGVWRNRGTLTLVKTRR